MGRGKRRDWLGVFAAAFFVTAAGAAPLSLDEAFRAAVKGTEPLPIQQTIASQADEEVVSGFGHVLPNVAFNTSYTHQDPSGFTNAFTLADQWNARFTLTQPIFHGFGEWAELKARKLTLAAEQATLTATQLAVYSSVAEAYFNVLAAEKDREILKEQVDVTVRRVEDLKARVRIGRSRRGDLLAAESQVATVKSQLDAIEGQIRETREVFRLQTGITGTPELAPRAGSPDAPAPVESLLAELERRPDLEASRNRMEAAAERVGVARAGHYPGLDFQANYYLKRSGILQNTKWDLNLLLTIPLFQGGSTQSGVREAEEKRKQAELVAAQLRRQAERDIRTFHSQLVSGLNQVKSLTEAADTADKSLAEQMRDYRNGLVTNLDVLQALNVTEDAKRSLERTRYQAWTAWAKLAAAVGKIPSVN